MPCKIYYYALADEQTKTEKLEWFKNTKLQDIDFELVKPDKNANWINLTDNDFESLIPVCSKETKGGKGGNAIFELFSLGVNTNRDEWAYDFNKQNLISKMIFFSNVYNVEAVKHKGKNADSIWDDLDYSIKWASDLRNNVSRGIKVTFDENFIIKSHYRPFTSKYIYFNKEFIERKYKMPEIFGYKNSYQNKIIGFSGISSSKPFATLATNTIIALDFLEKTQCLPLYRYVNGERVDNITDWALELFRGHYESSLTLSPPTPEGGVSTSKTPPSGVGGLTKLDIFHYVYAVLHQPAYRTKYEQNLKREFPRIPLYADFWKYAEAGKKLMDLHLNYENLTPSPSPFGEGGLTPPSGAGGLLVRKDIDLEVFKASKQGKKKKTMEVEMTSFSKDVISETPFTVYPILKIKDGNIEIDELTTLCGVPAEALAYKLGNRSAIEWVLDQYKPYKSDDPTIQAQFNNYNFADYKEQVIDLLQKVTWVSVETMKIVKNL